MFLCLREKPFNDFHQLGTDGRRYRNKSHLQTCAAKVLSGPKTAGESTELSIDKRPALRILGDVLVSISPLADEELDALEDV